ncbi:unnamed protein product, partial [Ectocarpus sp. 6 AP-2014]
ISLGDCADYDPSHALDLDDASRMNQMHEAPLLDLLHRRFRANSIYTNVADVLVSINPYTDIPGLYDIPMPVVKAVPGVLPGLNVSVRGPSAGGRVAERSAALMREFKEGQDDRHPNKRGNGKRAKELDAKSKLTALKSMLGKPHVYGVADRAFKYMSETKGREVDGRVRRRNQSILITGESGAGKTEASKHVMRFLITASRALAGTAPAPPRAQGYAVAGAPVAGTPKAYGVAGTPTGGRSTQCRSAPGFWRSPAVVSTAAGAAKHMEDVLLRSNTVLEAFGNAKTVRNDNSSRFGKYIKLQYDHDFRLVGARTEHFLLEKSRLVHLEESERSYHILYQVAKALPMADKEAFHLQGGAECFSLLTQGNRLGASDDVDDHEEFHAVDKALSSLDFTANDKTDMWRLLAAILHSGEVSFEDVSGKEQCRISKVGRCTSISPADLAALWGVDEEVFEEGVMRRTVTAGGTSASVALNAAQAKENLLALLKHMYRQLFAWINWKINVVFDVPKKAVGEAGAGADRTFIGILDIFGFEIMATNSFEQLCINFANEVLQRQFNHHIFEEYGEEGLDVASIPFRDNQKIIDLIAKRPAGLMPILEDQARCSLCALTGRKAASITSSFTDKNLLDLFHQQHHRKAPHPCYRKPRFDGPEFVIMHYAGNVTYCATGFLEKNNDTLQEDLRGLLLSSRIPFLRQLILGENGVFNKAQGTSTADEDHANDSDPITSNTSAYGDVSNGPNGKANTGQRLHGRQTPGVGDRSVSFANSTAISKRAMFAYGGGGGGGGSGVWPAEEGGGGGGGRRGGMGKRAAFARIAAKSTVSNAFRSQLDDLVAQLRETEPHYIKCIKPNSDKAPGGWTSSLVIEQLRYSGVLEVVRIRREAFPMRVTYKQFYRRFGTLLVSKDMPTADDVTSAKAREVGLGVCKAVFGEKEAGSSFQMGKTKVFLRDDGLKRLRAALRLHYFTIASKIQALWRGSLARAKIARQREAAKKLQKLARGNTARRRYREAQRAAKAIQALARMQQARALVARQQVSVVKMQATWRGWRQREWRKREANATRLQAVARGFVTRKRRERMEAAATLQAACRAKAARKEVAILRKRKRVREETASTRIAAVWRGKSERLYGARRRAKERQAQTRVWALREEYLQEEAMACRAQRSIRAFLRNRRLRDASIQVFQAARSGDVPTVARHLSEWPALLFLRDRHDGDAHAGMAEGGAEKIVPSYSTLLHAACQGGAIEVVALLEPFLSEITDKDRWGNTAIHVAAAECNYDLLKFLAHRANLEVRKAVRAAARGQPAPRPAAFPLGMSKEAFILAAGMVRRLRLAEAAVPPFRARHQGGIGAIGHGQGREENCGRGEEQRLATLRLESLRMESWEGGQPMVEGFLKKRRETDRWLKRWCQLKRFAPPAGEAGHTGPALFYFKKKADALPSKIIMLDHCLLKKSDDLDCAFELHSPLMMEGRNTEGRLYFQASNEVELQQWLLALRALVKFYDFKNEKRQLPMEYLHQGTRERLVRATNNLGETPLHLAVAFAGRTGMGDRRESDSGCDKREVGIAVQRVATWLLENGANPNACDEQGETPMHCVMRANNVDAALALQKGYGSVNLPRKTDWKTPLDLTSDNDEVWQRLRDGALVAAIAPKLTVGDSAAEAGGTSWVQPAPAKLLGFTYVSVFLETLVVASAADIGKPTLTVSVFSAKGKLVESAQELDSPTLFSSMYLWWGRTWHMQTPLETLGPGSSMVFELRDIQGGSKKAICWGALPLDPDHLNTQPEKLSTYLAPVDPARLMAVAFGSGGRGGGFWPLRADAALTADVSLTRLLR